MRLIIDLPDTTLCVIASYVYGTETGMSLGTKSIGTDELENIKVIKSDEVLRGEGE